MRANIDSQWGYRRGEPVRFDPIEWLRQGGTAGLEILVEHRPREGDAAQEILRTADVPAQIRALWPEGEARRGS